MKNTLFIGKVYHRFDELPSTNDWSADLLAKSKPPEGTVVRADRQSAGRGQFGSRWESEPGKNLTLSVILYPNWLEISAQFYLSMAVALALRDTVDGGRGTARDIEDKTFSDQDTTALHRPPSTVYRPPSTLHRPPCTVKWPNDLYLGDRKTAGILIQNTISGHHLQASIVGIGLNVNQIEFDPALPNPGSLALSFGQNFDCDEVAARLFECLERRYLQLKSGQREAIREMYEQSLFRLGTPSLFVRTGGPAFEGVICGVTEAGRLKVELSDRNETFEVKELRMVI